MAKKNARLSKNEKTSAPSRRKFTEQTELFEPAPLCVTFPNSGTLDAICLEMLLSGQTLTSPKFQGMTQSWRLAACVDRLSKRHGWPVLANEVNAPTNRRRYRPIAEYALRPDAIKLVKGGTHDMA